jgi:hypothetical protein
MLKQALCAFFLLCSIHQSASVPASTDRSFDWGAFDTMIESEELQVNQTQLAEWKKDIDTALSNMSQSDCQPPPRPPASSHCQRYAQYAAQYAFGASCSMTHMPNGKVALSDCPACSDRAMQSLEFVEYLWDAKTTTEGFIGVDHERKSVVVSIRGSNNWQDWLSNLNFAMRSMEPFGPKGVKVHSGFHHAYSTIADKVVETTSALVTKNAGYEVLFTGHSLGGGKLLYCTSRDST